MPKKKIIRAEDITEKDILSLYESTLPFLYKDENGIIAIGKLEECLLRFVAYDSPYFLALNPEKKNDNIIAIQTEGKKEKSNFSIKTTTMKDADTAFDEVGEEIYKAWIEKARAVEPEKDNFDHYRILSREEPKAMAGFFRFFKRTEDKSFSQEEKQIFEKLAPHILTLTRTFHSFAFKSKAQQYFETYTNICSKLAVDYDLSDLEYKIMIELLFGKSNEIIAKENFVSVAAVKKQITHILKKTSTKNRVDFISKFFTSPDRINL